MSRAKIATSSEGRYLVFRCPGCQSFHAVPVEGSRAWGWNGSVDLPKLTPSLLVRYEVEDDGKPVKEICHSFVTDGRIVFLPDCTHALAGQTVDLPEIEETP